MKFFHFKGTGLCSFFLNYRFTLKYVFLTKQYGLDIEDGNQVLLVSHVKKITVAGSTPGPAMLIPELCYLTGILLSDFSFF